MKKDLIHVVDEIMGGGKTTAIFTYINHNPKKKFIFLTPKLDEIPRVKECCPSLHFKEPNPDSHNKTKIFKSLLEKRENIVTTHQLFFQQTEDISALLRGYTLIIDEAPNSLVKDYDDKYHSDFPVIFKNYLRFDENNRAFWVYNPTFEEQDEKGYIGAFSKLKEDCDKGYVQCVENEGSKYIFKVFPANILYELDEIFVLTHLFKLQPAYAFFKSEGFTFDRYYVKEENGKYSLTNIPQPEKHVDFLPKIKIYYDKGKKNGNIGSRKGSLSKTWYRSHKTSKMMHNALRRFIDNTVIHSSDCIWTVYTEFMEKVSCGRYNSSFISCNAKATNNFADRHAVAYMINLYSRPVLSVYYKSKGVSVCDNGFGLTEMIQLIFRSAIRNGEDIHLYIPSKRMRDLFLAWVEFAAGRTDRIAGINVDLYDWDSSESTCNPETFQNEIINVDTGLLVFFDESAEPQPVLQPRGIPYEGHCPRSSSKRRDIAYEALCTPWLETEPELDYGTDMDGFLLGYDDVPEGIGDEPM